MFFTNNFFYKQAGKSGHLWVCLISSNNNNNNNNNSVIDPLHVQLIKIKIIPVIFTCPDYTESQKQRLQ